MNLASVPTWAWIVAGVLAFLWAKRKGLLDASPAAGRDASSRTGGDASPTPAGAAQVVELRHVVDSSPSSSPATSSDELTETRTVGFEFEVAVRPRPKNPPPGMP